MLRLIPFFITVYLVSIPIQAADKLVLDLDMDTDLMSMSHHVDGFLFKPTMNFSANVGGNLSEIMKIDSMKNRLIATALVRINGKVAGVATEQEVLVFDDKTGKKKAESAWLIMLSYPGKSGFLAVKQQEDAAGIFAVISKVMQNPDGDWEDKFQRFLSTSNSPKVQLAVDDLAVYRGGRFEEYNFVNPADLRNLGRFRAKIQFVIYPGE